MTALCLKIWQTNQQEVRLWTCKRLFLKEDQILNSDEPQIFRQSEDQLFKFRINRIIASIIAAVFSELWNIPGDIFDFNEHKKVVRQVNLWRDGIFEIQVTVVESDRSRCRFFAYC